MGSTNEVGVEATGGTSEAAVDAGRFSIRASGPEDRFAIACLLAFVAAVCAYLTFIKNLFYDGDSGWHLAAGRYILETRSVPHMDPLLILDGVPQSDPFGGWVNWPAYDPAALAEVRVVRGGGSVANGPDALDPRQPRGR